MIKKEIKFIDLNGNERTTTGYFHLNKLEAQEFSNKYNGLDNMLMEASEALQNNPSEQMMMNGMKMVTDMIGDLVLKAYGQPSEDGTRFCKSEELTKAFEQSEAYPEMVLNLIESPKDILDFMVAVMPTKSLDPAKQKVIDEVLKQTKLEAEKAEQQMQEAISGVTNDAAKVVEASMSELTNDTTHNTSDDIVSPIGSTWVAK